MLAGAAVLIALTLAAPAPGAPAAIASGKAGLAKFAGAWIGHTRHMEMTRRGFAKERIDDGCCHEIIDLKFRLSRARVTSSGAIARARVTAVHVHDRSVFTKRHPPPHVGERRWIRLKHDVVHERLTGAIYCRAGKRDPVCGA
jgi:hypothetical protein